VLFKLFLYAYKVIFDTESRIGVVLPSTQRLVFKKLHIKEQSQVEQQNRTRRRIKEKYIIQYIKE